MKFAFMMLTALVLSLTMSLPQNASAEDEPKARVQMGDEGRVIIPAKTWNDNGRKNLSDFQGHYVLVVTWATW